MSNKANDDRVQQTRRGRLIWKGWAKDTDPIYSGGWNFLSTKHLNPRSDRKSEKPTEQRAAGEGQGVSGGTGLWYWLPVVGAYVLPVIRFLA
jgi:hypothetical protein